MRLALLRSIRNPTTTGWLRSRVKNWMVCSFPPSKMRKSPLSKSDTKRPLSSVTVTGTITSLTWTLMSLLGISLRSTGGAWTGGGCVEVTLDGGCAHTEENTTAVAITRNDIGRPGSYYKREYLESLECPEWRAIPGILGVLGF